MSKNKNTQSGFAHLITIIVGVVVLFGVAGAFMLVKSKAAALCTPNVYSQGVNGSSCVKDIQALLNWQNIGQPNLTVDGNFGPKTKAAVIASQTYWKLKVDGVVGKQTWNIICYPQMGPGIPPSFPLANARHAGCNI